LTTLGLIIQHHIFNVDNVLNTNNYKFVDLPKTNNNNASSVTILMPNDNSELVLQRSTHQTFFSVVSRLIPKFIYDIFNRIFRH